MLPDNIGLSGIFEQPPFFIIRRSLQKLKLLMPAGCIISRPNNIIYIK